MINKHLKYIILLIPLWSFGQVDIDLRSTVISELDKIGECGLDLRISSHSAVYDKNDSIIGTRQIVVIRNKKFREICSQKNKSELNDILLDLVHQKHYSWNCNLLLFNLNSIDGGGLRDYSDCSIWMMNGYGKYVHFWEVFFEEGK